MGFGDGERQHVLPDLRHRVGYSVLMKRKLRVRTSAHDQPELRMGVTEQEVQSSCDISTHQSVRPVQDEHHRAGMVEEVGR